MDLKTQKRLASQVLNCSQKRVVFDPASLHEIKEAITKADIKGLVNEGLIKKLPVKGVSRVRARKNALQRSKGLRKGPGSKKAKKTASITKKESWIKKIRIQRAFLLELKSKGLLSPEDYKSLYRKSKGGFFRSKRHIKIYIDEKNLIKK